MRYISVIWREDDTVHHVDLIINLVGNSMIMETKLKRYFKIFSSLTAHQILMQIKCISGIK